MKAFAFGALAGALVCFAMIRVTGPSVAQPTVPESAPAPAPAPARSTAPVDSPNVRTASTPATPVTARKVEPIKTVESSAPGERPDSPAPSTGLTLVTKKCLSVDNLSEQELFAISQRAHQLRQQREQATKDAEPKDPAWAYSMEMLIRQHMESQLPRDQYSKMDIQCRTTFCELKMTGSSGTDGWNSADRVAKEIARQPWSDIARRGGGSGSDGNGWHLEYEWYRPRTESERKAWFQTRDSQ